jgi:4-hydroxybenzoate polyprenyltransferase|tara:strand:+ start:861 stop:1697 length:837 start_codon:yes stop_codon:yes gene_type:complete
MFASRLSSLLKSTHPMPSLAVALFATLFAVGGGLAVERVALVGLAVLLQQFSVGLSNDWLDHKRDRASGRTDKPVAQGSLDASLVRNSSFASGVLALLVSGLLGWESLGWMVFMLVAGWAYNLGLKATAFSVLPYAIGFGILPVFVTLSLEQSQMPPAWVVVVAALLGVSAHFANTLPDLLEDRATGVRALPHIVGQKISALIIATTAILASSIAVYQSDTLPAVVGVVGLMATILLACIASVLSLRPTPPRIIFPLLVLASLVNAILLMLGVGPIGV